MSTYPRTGGVPDTPGATHSATHPWVAQCCAMWAALSTAFKGKKDKKDKKEKKPKYAYCLLTHAHTHTRTHTHTHTHTHTQIHLPTLLSANHHTLNSSTQAKTDY
jgi:hypothetical protein